MEHAVAGRGFPAGEGIRRNFRANPHAEVVRGRNEPALQHRQRAAAKALTGEPESARRHTAMRTGRLHENMAEREA